MTDDQLDAILFRADTCPKTVSAEEARAALDACEARGWPVPKALKIVLVTRLIEGPNVA